MIKYLEKKEEFETYIKQKLILVDFYADWCGPCKMLGNILEQVDFIEILKLNVDQFPEFAQKYGIMSIPTICIFSDGNLVRREVGFLTLDKIKEIIQNIKKEIE